MQVCVDSQTIAEVVAGWTGIPVGKMVANEIQTVLNLQDKLEERVIGQSHALEAIAQRIRTARANLTDPRRPIGVFLLVGPSGVGKTETALALADTLYGGERNLITINMSEYQEAHTVSGLKGSPPGYVGYGEGGVLTEAVRRRPYSVVLLDEVEKAHPDVLELFFQVFDKGTLEDGEGREIDFKNTVILLTSNVGTETILKLCTDPDTTPTPEVLAEAVRPDLLAAKTERGVQIFKQAFLGRLIVVPYLPDLRRGHAADHQAPARPHRPADAREPQRDLQLRRRAHRLHRRPLPRGRERRPQRRPHPDPDAPPRDLPGDPRPHGRGPEHLPGARLGRRQGGLRLRHRVSRSAVSTCGECVRCRVDLPRGRDPSPVRVIEQLLQAIAERCREAGGPGRVEKADADQIAKVSSVLVAPGDQLHPHQRFERGYPKFDGSFRFVDFGQMEVVVPSNFLTGVEEMDSTARFPLRPVDEGVDVEEFVIDEPDPFKTGPRRGKIRTPDQDIDIARIADGVLVNPGDPLGDGVATDHRIRDPGLIEGSGGSSQPLFDLLRCHERPFPTDGFDCCFRHDKRSL